MPGTNNFLRWNPGASNQQSDATYAADSQRLSGAATPSLFAAQLANKAFFQWSVMTFALAQMMANKGYNLSDADETNLIGALTNILTQADVPALLNNTPLTGNPTAPTPATGDNDTSIATTEFVRAAAAQVPQRVTLGSNVNLTANVLTSIITKVVTFPAGGGVYRADVRYSMWATIGPDALATVVVDTTNNRAFAGSGLEGNGAGFVGAVGSELSSATYAAGATVTFVLKAICNAGGHQATVDSGLFAISPAAVSFLEITPVLSA